MLSHNYQKSLGNGTTKYKETGATKAEAVKEKTLTYNPRNKCAQICVTQGDYNTHKLLGEVPGDPIIYKVWVKIFVLDCSSRVV